jgi:hypothetical protein
MPDIFDRVAELVHRRKIIDAAGTLAEEFKIKLKLNSEKSANNFLLGAVHNLLNTGRPDRAAQILWSPTQFTAEPSSVKAVWNLYDTANMGLIMGAAKMGKSFSMGVRLFLEWVRDPEWTSIRVIGPSENHLEENLFSHLVALHSRAALEMPGEVGSLFIGLNRRDQLSSIRGLVIPKGNTKKAGRLQGGHRRPRAVSHPIFGPLSRLFIFLDEIENVPNGVWLDIDNVLSEIEKEGGPGSGFKIFGAYNPTNSGDEVAKRAEPPFGWSSVDEETHFRWKSIRGWEVLRLDAEKTENVLQGKMIFPGLQTREGLETIALNAGGRNAPGYRTMGRGMYPSMGMEATVVPPGMLDKWRGTFIWYEDPQPVGSTDLALEGGANCVHTLGKFGRATGIKWPSSLLFPNGHTQMFKDRAGQVMPRWALQANSQFVFPKGDTVVMKEGILLINRRSGTVGKYYACDRTGHGAGIADLLKYEWSGEIHDVNYSGGSSEEKLMAEDTKTCKEQFERMQTELWFALRAWGEFGYFLLDPAMDLSKLTQQLTQRRFRTSGGKSKVESKKDYMSRGFASPDEADSLTLLIHAARKGSGLILSMRGDHLPDVPGADPNSPGEDWPGQYENGVHVDVSNKADYLDTAERLPFDYAGIL